MRSFIVLALLIASARHVRVLGVQQQSSLPVKSFTIDEELPPGTVVIQDLFSEFREQLSTLTTNTGTVHVHSTLPTITGELTALYSADRHCSAVL